VNPMSIHLLPDEVASQIAAGEVVERPASVVKELLENSLDAGARQITIRIEQYGKSLIEVADDGQGIPASELTLAVMRHATSKLQSAQELFHIATLGFRGEALASIGSVSHLTLTSHNREDEVGARIQVDGGRPGQIEPVGAPFGTQVRVENLFFNVPARLKFLKQDATERQQIETLVTRYAVAYPTVRFLLAQDGRSVLQTSGNGRAREVLAALYGVEIARQMLEVTLAEDEIKIGGFTSPVALTRSNRRELTFFVNGRWVQDIALNTALLQAYHTLLMVGRYPMAILFLEIPAEEVDVNVHPAKAEVRFRHSDQIFSTVQRAVRRALLAYSPIPQVSTSGWHHPDSNRLIDPAWELAGSNPATFAASTPAMPHAGDIAPQTELPAQTAPGQETELPSGQLPILRLIGQIGATYLVAEGPDGLYLIDQHAAHERVLFERYQKQLSGPIPAQSLLEPVLIQLPPHSAQSLLEKLPLLGSLGFQVETFGPETFRVRAVPAFLASGDPSAAVRVVVEDFEEDETPLQAELEMRLAARICKRMAVKGGQILAVEEQKKLLHDLETCQSPRTCPHGRPTMIHLSVDLLERQFGRRGSR
jgi:DNA mismatch repair protein MutL